MKILYLPDFYSQQRQRDVKATIYPVLMAMEATKYHNEGHDVIWNRHLLFEDEVKYDKIIKEPEGLPFLTLPFPDRRFTRWQDYQDNGNFRYLPGTYIQSARDCWYHGCTFCSWVKKYPVCETRSVTSVIAEIEQCADMGFRDIFDDSGTFPVGYWLKDFCNQMIATGLNKRVHLSCNMRFGVLHNSDFRLMKEAGFRMILWGMESINQNTLDRLNKGISKCDFVELYLARLVGIWNHVAVMYGYPWETEKDALRTYEYVKRNLLSDTIQSVQASIYDVSEVKKVPTYAYELRRMTYHLHYNPRYIFNRLKEIRSIDDIQYYLRTMKRLWEK